MAEARSSSGERAVAELGVGLELHVERNALVLRSDSMVRRLPAEVEKVGATALQIRLVTLQPPRVARIEMVSASEAELTGFSGNAETRIVLRRASR